MDSKPSAVLEHLLDDPRPWIAAAAEKVIETLGAEKDRDTEVWNRESGIKTL